LEVIDVPDGHHGFDFLDHDGQSRDAVERGPGPGAHRADLSHRGRRAARRAAARQARRPAPGNRAYCRCQSGRAVAVSPRRSPSPWARMCRCTRRR
jgi:hypothetical protein